MGERREYDQGLALPEEWASMIGGSEDVTITPDTFPLDSEAQMSHNTWAQLAHDVMWLNKTFEPEVILANGQQNGWLRAQDGIIRIGFTHWVESRQAIDGRMMTELILDFARPGVITARDTIISYPETHCEQQFSGPSADKVSGQYLATSGDTIQFVEHSYTLNDEGAQVVIERLAELRPTLASAAEEAFDATLESLEPGLKQACTRYFVRQKSLLFDIEREFVTKWDVVEHPWQNRGLALLADLPGRIELYIGAGQWRQDVSKSREHWTQYTWQKEDFPDNFRYQDEEPTEVIKRTLPEILEIVPPEQHEYVRKWSEWQLRHRWMSTRRGPNGIMGVNDNAASRMREEYPILYQQFRELFPDYELNLPPDLSD